MRLKRVVLALVTVVLLLGSSRLEALACGGFFCTTKPIDQTAERIIFSVKKSNGTITAVVGISYTGESSEFSWVVPVPSPPKLDVAETKSLDAFGAATNLQFITPQDPCPRPMMAVADAPTGGGGGFLQTGQVGPYDYAIIKNERTDDMIAWLRDNGYRITKEMEPLVIQYVKEGLYFLAMKLKRGANVNEIKPVVMTYQAVHPMIPLRLTAVAAVEDMQVLVWILGETQYVPQNYAHPTIDFSRMKAGFQPVQENGTLYTSLVSYRTEQKAMQNEYNGQAFLTEYAQPSATLLAAPELTGDGKLDPVVAGLLQKAAYVTRLRAQMSPNQMIVDPTFIPDDTAPNVSNVVDLNKYVDTYTFWGCPEMRPTSKP
ncbi:MAG: DUF2330 domain-containing protein [Chloroflexota bacterium]